MIDAQVGEYPARRQQEATAETDGFWILQEPDGQLSKVASGHACIHWYVCLEYGVHFGTAPKGWELKMMRLLQPTSDVACVAFSLPYVASWLANGACELSRGLNRWAQMMSASWVQPALSL